MALGLHGHPGAVAADPVVKEQSPERVPVRLPRLGGSPAWEWVRKAKAAKLGNAQVGETLSTFKSWCAALLLPVLYLRNTFDDKLNTISHSDMVKLGILEQLQ